MNSSFALRALGLLAAITLPTVSVATAADDLSGRYVVVDRRGASDVAATRDAISQAMQSIDLGAEAIFASTLVWIDGRTCDDWQVTVRDDGASFVTFDPLLSDLQVPPVGEVGQFEDFRLNQDIEIMCAGDSFAYLTRVDAQVLVTASANGTVNFILEKPLSHEEAERLQSGLNGAGFDAGPVDGTIGAQTRAAIAAYAEWRGAEFRMKSGVVTRNLLDGLSFSAYD